MKRLWVILPVFSLVLAQNFLPKPTSGSQTINHLGYTLSYNETHEQANWVAYELTAEEVRGSVKRKDAFRPDPLVKTGSASLADYKGSGYDRGHLAPAADMKWSSTAMSESFFMSNMSPQNPSFNRGVWKRLEGHVRKWAYDNESIHITTGGVLTDRLTTIGTNRVSVPRFYYKVILDYQEPEIKGIGFILPNESIKKSLELYAVSIDEVEKFTGLDFYYTLPDDIENKVESVVDVSRWSFKPYKSSSSGGTATQCLGNTKKGNRCGNRTKNDSGYCYLHDPSKVVKKAESKLSVAIQCGGITKKGKRCKRKTKSPNGYCYQHGGN
jgi:endonuclease G